MVLKVTTAPGADISGLYRRPRLMLRPIRVEDIPTILGKPKAYPTPVRAMGADYSCTRCVGGDGGTIVDTSALDKILEFGENTVRAQAGVRVGVLVRALAERGQELALTPEIGNMSVGALAVSTLPQASYQEGAAQMSCSVIEMRLITPQGKQMTVTERDRDLMRVLRSSFGLLGIVYEVVLRVLPLRPVKIDYQVYSLADFTARYQRILAAPGALRLHLAPFNDRITVEQRCVDTEKTTTRSGIWQIRNSVMRNVLPAFGSSVGSVLSSPGLRNAVLSGVHRALNAASTPAARGVVMFAHEWMRDLPSESWKARYTHSLWAFPAADYPRVLTEYFAFCRSYYKENRYRSNVVTGASRLHKDRSSLFSMSYGGPMLTLEPSSGGEKGWADYLIDFNDFASQLGGTPTFNQTRSLKPEHVAKAFGERARLFRALRQRTDPLNRLYNNYFAGLFD
ncbi:MAG: FAD-binding oxidoreductase [Steroidobacteraceae bacterium]|jgi:FAD/FMN-containing dehydrogenase